MPEEAIDNKDEITKDKLYIEFQDAVKEDYGRDITYGESYRILSDLAVYFSTLQTVYDRMND